MIRTGTSRPIESGSPEKLTTVLPLGTEDTTGNRRDNESSHQCKVVVDLRCCGHLGWRVWLNSDIS